MERKVLVTYGALQIQDLVYPLFKEGWKLDPWFHSTGRPWMNEAGEQATLTWNLIRIGLGDNPADKLWVERNAPLFHIETPSVEIPAIEKPGEFDSVELTMQLPHGQSPATAGSPGNWRVYKVYEKVVIWLKEKTVLTS